MLESHPLLRQLSMACRTWLVTGVAGFIGSNLLEALLRANQRVIGLDNFSTGKAENIDEVLSGVTADQRCRFKLIAGDICHAPSCDLACDGVDYVLHEAALGSVPRSIEDPVASHDSNVNGFLNMLVAARDHRVRRFVYASSSSVYGDDAALPKVEDLTGAPLSPYAVTKCVNELYARVFTRVYGLETVGLRYFNVFGPRQDPHGAYAAVIPRWIAAMMNHGRAVLNGDGSTSRDFCYVANVVQANLLAATCSHPGAPGASFNIALGGRTTLRELFACLREKLEPDFPHLRHYEPELAPFRCGDIAHSQADISRAKAVLGYTPTHSVPEGLDAALDWYKSHVQPDLAFAAAF